MFRKLIFLAVVAVGGVLPFTASSLGARSAEALCFGSVGTITGSGTITGTAGDDVIIGSDGNNVILGLAGNDKLCGGAGDDTLGGGPGNDQLDGGPGNDTLSGGPGNDTLLAGEGDDSIQCGTDNDVADGGPGTNTAVTTGSEACETVTNASPPAAPPTPSDATCFGSAATITGSGTIDGTMGDDVIVGSDGNDSIHGKGGNDKVCGGAGDDKLGGGPGDDQVDGGPGNDDVDGGLGNDTVLGGEGDDEIACGTGEDIADGGPGSNTAVTTGFEACETVTNANSSATVTTPKPLAATLTAGQEVPRPKGARRGTGRFTGTMETTGSGATLVWRLTFVRLSGGAVAAHIHRGRPGQAGPVIVALCSPCRSGVQRTTTVTGQPARNAISSGQAYVNLHTAKNPAGEIRGQLRRLDK